MDLTVLAVPGCPNAPVLGRRVSEVVAGRPGVTIRLVEIADLAAASRYGMCGSPTLLVDGFDPFARPGAGPAVACRLYRDERGQASGAPSVAALRRVLDQDGGGGDQSLEAGD